MTVTLSGAATAVAMFNLTPDAFTTYGLNFTATASGPVTITLASTGTGGGLSIDNLILTGRNSPPGREGFPLR